MSHERAARAWKDGLLDRQVAFVNDLRTDETIRPGTSAETLAGLRPAFHSDDWAAAYPTIDWRVTAGNRLPGQRRLGRGARHERGGGRPPRPATAGSRALLRRRR
nr:hypothetical protein [Nocardioides convexus]